MVLRKSGRVGHRRFLEKDISFAGILFLFVALWGHKLPGLKSWVTINADFVRPVGADK